MKSALFISACCGLFLFALVPSLQAQESKSQKYVIHEDVVIPNQLMKYEKASKALVDALKEHGGPESQFLAVALEDMRYLFVSPIENMAALDNNPFASLSEALGEEGSDALWSNFDDTYTTHTNYIVNLSHDLSYNSGEIYEEGVDFRHFEYYFIDPDKSKEAKAIAKEWKELFTAKNIPSGYRVYTGGLGTHPMIMVVEWAKSPSEYYAQQEKVREMLGDEAKELMGRTMAITQKFESVDGMIRPDLSFMPEATMAGN